LTSPSRVFARLLKQCVVRRFANLLRTAELRSEGLVLVSRCLITMVTRIPCASSSALLLQGGRCGIPCSHFVCWHAFCRGKQSC